MVEALAVAFYRYAMLYGAMMTGRTLRTVEDLVDAGFAGAAQAPALAAVAEKYAVAIPQALAALIGTADDPIGLQFVPDVAELVIAPHESGDPVADEALSPVPGIVHRYSDRVLLKPLLACPVYCRFCFRREQVGPEGGVLTAAELAAGYDYIRGQPGVREVIITGGDPLMLSPRRLGEILQALSAIPHVEVLRIHTRVPVATPELVSDALAAALDIAAPLFVVLHTNHVRELTPAAVESVAKLQRRGIPVLGQTVLLAGVNDSEAALADLFRAMLRARVKPYYLHQLDAAPGTARFHVAPARGRALLAALRGRISGTAIPTYIYDQPGGAGKIPL
jgi:lysine 2,3-aminomutase